MQPMQQFSRIRDLVFLIEDRSRSRMIHLQNRSKDITRIIDGVKINRRNTDVFFIEQFQWRNKISKKKWFVQCCCYRFPRSLSSSSSLKTRCHDTNGRKQWEKHELGLNKVIPFLIAERTKRFFLYSPVCFCFQYMSDNFYQYMYMFIISKKKHLHIRSILENIFIQFITRKI